MSDYGVTDKGFQMRRLDEIYTDICKRFKDEVGVDPSENPQSVMNVLFTIFADAPAELWEAYAAAYQQLFPNTACGVALDNVMQVGGVSRIGQAKTKYFISCTGQEGTVIPVGALIQSSSRPQRTFQAVSASIISSANWRKLAIRPIESIAGTFTFDFGISRNATSGEVGTYAESSSITKKMTVSSYDDAYSQMLAAVQSFDALGKFGITVSDETDDQGEHSIVLTASGAADSFSATLCKYITVTEVTSNIQFESAEYGSYAALNLELDAPINTTTTMLVSTMPWESGTTECVPGHSDGCRGSLTNGKYPYRVAGIEMQIGAYIEQLDPLWKASIVDDDHWHYDVFSCKSGEKQVDSISSDYAQTGSFDLNDKVAWSWHYIRKLGKLGAEAMMYEKFNGSGSTYVRAAFSSPSSAGLYAPWRGGILDAGACCGLPCAYGNLSPASSGWHGVPRLAGSGKKRG